MKPEQADTSDTQATRRVHGIPPDEAVVFWRLRAALSYDPDSGEFRCLTNRGTRAKIGCVAGYINGRGYRQIAIEGRMYLAHRLAWFWMTGEWPSTYIDHVDGDPANNRWANLREATNSQNLANSRRSRVNKSGFKGVSLSRDGKWKVQIWADKTQHYLGLFDTKEEAHAAYSEAAKRLYGDFARVA